MDESSPQDENNHSQDGERGRPLPSPPATPRPRTSVLAVLHSSSNTRNAGLHGEHDDEHEHDSASEHIEDVHQHHRILHPSPMPPSRPTNTINIYEDQAPTTMTTADSRLGADDHDSSFNTVIAVNEDIDMSDLPAILVPASSSPSPSSPLPEPSSADLSMMTVPASPPRDDNDAEDIDIFTGDDIDVDISFPSLRRTTGSITITTSTTTTTTTTTNTTSHLQPARPPPLPPRNPERVSRLVEQLERGPELSNPQAYQQGHVFGDKHGGPVQTPRCPHTILPAHISPADSPILRPADAAAAYPTVSLRPLPEPPTGITSFTTASSCPQSDGAAGPAWFTTAAGLRANAEAKYGAHEYVSRRVVPKLPSGLRLGDAADKEGEKRYIGGHYWDASGRFMSSRWDFSFVEAKRGSEGVVYPERQSRREKGNRGLVKGEKRGEKDKKRKEKDEKREERDEKEKIVEENHGTGKEDDANEWMDFE